MPNRRKKKKPPGGNSLAGHPRIARRVSIPGGSLLYRYLRINIKCIRLRNSERRPHFSPPKNFRKSRNFRLGWAGSNDRRHRAAMVWWESRFFKRAIAF